MATATENMRGAGLMSLCMAAFTLNDACMRAIAGDLPIPQILCLRGALTATLLAALAVWRGQMLSLVRLPRRDRRLLALRSLGEVITGFSVVISLNFMSLSTFTAIGQAGPLSLTLAGALFLGEPVGWRRLLAILVGFCGVLLIIRPGAEAFHPTSLFALCAVAGLTLRDLVARRISAAAPPMIVALGGAVAVTLASGVWSLWADWSVPAPATGLGIVTGAVCLVAAYVLSVMAMQVGEIGFVAPFRYAGLVWALVLGIVFLGERPDLLTLAGAAVVVGTGGYTFYRERTLARRRALAARTGG